MLGTVLATGLPVLILYGQTVTLRAILHVFMISVAILLPITVILALRFTPSVEILPSPFPSVAKSLAIVRRNKPFLRLLGGIFLFWLAANIWNAMVLFMLQHTLDLPTADFLWFVFVQFCVGCLALPGILRLSNAVGKHRALAVGGLCFYAMLPLFLLVPHHSYGGAMAVFVALGVFTAFIWVVPPALVADVIEYGVLKGGGDQAALYVAIYNLVQKFALAASVGIALPLASRLGFDPVKSGDEAGSGGLSFVALFLPGLIALVAGAIMFNYPLDARRHGIIRRRIDRLSRGAAAAPAPVRLMDR